MRRVITSRAFREKLGTELDVEWIFLEDLLAPIGKAQKLAWLALAVILPPFVVERLFFSRALTRHDLATVMFSSGSTGTPKGVMLSHENIASNVESIYDVYQLAGDDCLLGILPLFHSFGFMGTMWLPLLGGIRAVYHPNPIDGAAIGELCAKHRGTILMSTPTFLLNYIRKVPAEHFASLRHVIVGAEKLKQRVADAFVEKFGVLPREGYGCTELSPVAMVNIPDFDAKGIRQQGSKPGTVGHPIPGVAARVVDLESGELRPPGEPGMLVIKGPNVMLGYLNNPEKTREVIRDGWYVTGDIAVLDEEGFVTITDRLSRFSKIGGEMVPHVKIEEEIQLLLGAGEQSCVVTAIADEKKGERLIVLTVRDFDAAAVISGLAERGLPNLWIPKRESFFRVEKFPVLGTGKLDLQQVRKLAAELAGGRDGGGPGENT